MQAAGYWAQEPRWTLQQTLAVQGRVRGVLLRHWARHCRRRWGETAVAQVRVALAPALLESGLRDFQLPDEPEETAWYPAALQLALTDAIVTTCLDGDATRLGPLVREDTLRDLGPVQRLAARALGPARAYARATAGYAHLYDVGQVCTQTRESGCLLELRGTPLFDHPTWRLLQLWAHAVALELLHGRPGEVQGEALPDGFAIDVAWS